MQHMDKRRVPESFGVFKPVGHVVMAFEREADRDGAHAELSRSGFDDEDLTRYTAQEMREQVQHELDTASGTASFGYEIVLAKEHLKLAERGHAWLIAYAPDGRRSATVAEIARGHHASIADRYGRLVVEHMLQPPPNS